MCHIRYRECIIHFAICTIWCNISKFLTISKCIPCIKHFVAKITKWVRHLRTSGKHPGNIFQFWWHLDITIWIEWLIACFCHSGTVHEHTMCWFDGIRKFWHWRNGLISGKHVITNNKTVRDIDFTSICNTNFTWRKINDINTLITNVMQRRYTNLVSIYFCFIISNLKITCVVIKWSKVAFIVDNSSTLCIINRNVIFCMKQIFVIHIYNFTDIILCHA